MSVRVIAYRFVGDNTDLDAAIGRSETSLKQFKRAAADAGDTAARASRTEAQAAREAEKAEKSKAAAAQKAAREQEQAAAKTERATQRQAREQAKAARAAEVASARAARDAETVRKKREAASERIGTGLVVAGAVTGYGIAKVVSEFADFDQAMSAAKAATQATGLELTRLRELAIKAGADTQYSATEAAQGITEMGKAGVSTKDILSGGLKGALDLAAAGQLDVADAAEISATALNQFNLSGAQIPHVADLLAAGAGKAQGNVKDLANALKYVGPVANGLRIPIEQTTGVLAELASKGVISEQAGTSTRGFLLSITDPSKKAAHEMKELGLSFYDAQGKFVGFRGVAGQLHEALSGLSEAQRNQALGVIFGNEQITAARILYDGGAEAVDAWTQKVNDSGFAARQAAALTDNLRGDLERFGGSLDTAFISSGSGTNDGLRQVTQGATAAVNAFAALPDPVQKSVVQLAALGTGVLILGGGLLILVPRIRAAKRQLDELAVSGTRTGRVLSVAGGAAKLGAALAISIPILDQITSKIDGVAENGSKLTGQLQAFARTGRLAGESAKAFGADLGGVNSYARSFDGHTESLAESVERLNKAHGFWGTVKFGDVTGMDASKKSIQAYGEALAGLVQEGQGQQAGEIFDKLAAKAGLQGDQTKQLLTLMPAYQEALDGQAAAAGAAGTNIGKLADGITQSGTAAAAARTKLEGLIAEAEKAVGKKFSEDTDVLSSYDPSTGDKAATAADRVAKAEERLADARQRAAAHRGGPTISQQQSIRHAEEALADAQAKAGKARADDAADNLAGTYAKTIKQARAFTRNLTEAARLGLDPKYIQKLLKEGPDQAGPILQEIVSDHSGRLVKIVNDSEAALAKIGRQAAEQARLTAIAVNSGTDELTGELDDALRIAQVKAELGAGATTEAIAKRLKLPAGTVNKIGRDFGITLVNAVQAAINKQRLTVQAQGEIKITGDAHADTRARSKTGGLAAGGEIVGPGTGTSDSVLLWGSNGEWVQPKAAVDYYGSEFMERVRTRSLPRRADGGPVGSVSNVSYSTTNVASPAVQPPGKAAGVQVVTIPLTTSETIHHHDPIHVGTVITKDAHSFTGRHAPRRFSGVLGAS